MKLASLIAAAACVLAALTCSAKAESFPQKLVGQWCIGVENLVGGRVILSRATGKCDKLLVIDSRSMHTPSRDCDLISMESDKAVLHTSMTCQNFTDRYQHREQNDFVFDGDIIEFRMVLDKNFNPQNTHGSLWKEGQK